MGDWKCLWHCRPQAPHYNDDYKEVIISGEGLNAGAGASPNDGGEDMDDNPAASNDDKNDQKCEVKVGRPCGSRGPMGGHRVEGPMEALVTVFINLLVKCPIF